MQLAPSLALRPRTSPRIDSVAIGADPSSASAWTPAKRVALRFAVLTTVFFVASSEPLGMLLRAVGVPYDPGYAAYYRTVARFTSWLTVGVLHVWTRDTIPPSYSAAWLINPVFAGIGTAIWSVVDRGRTDYTTLYRWYRTGVRWVLANVMWSYALMKFVGGQARPASQAELLEPLGTMAPKTLFWATMCYSYGYLLFSGMGEALGGLLLLWRRTTTLGALVSIAVLVPVLAFNVFYHIGVQDRAGPYLAMAIFLAAPDLGRLRAMYLTNTPVPAARPEQSVVTGRGHTALKAALLLTFLTRIPSSVTTRHRQLADRSRPLVGTYVVERFARGTDTLAPTVGDTRRWKHVVIDPGGAATIARMDDGERYYRFVIDTVSRKIVVSKGSMPGAARMQGLPAPPPGEAADGLLTDQRFDADHVELTGAIGGASVGAVLRRVHDEDFPMLRHTTFLAGQRGALFDWLR